MLGLLLIGFLAALGHYCPRGALGCLGFLAASLTVGMLTRRPTPRLPTFTSGNASGETCFFIHGWPDNKELWSLQLAHLASRYRLVCVDLPHFGARIPGVSKWGYDLDELTEMCAEALLRSLREAGQSKATLVIHDWGAVVGMMLQRRFPHLVSRMVILDVEWSERQNSPLQTFAMGLAYQYYLAFAWLLAACVPVLGVPMGNVMNRFFWWFGRMATRDGPPATSLENRPQPLTSLINYPYWYVQYGGWLEFLGVRKSFNRRHKCTASPVPTLFLYGADKSANFHSEAWEEELKRRGDSAVVPLRKQGRQVGHWVQVSAADEVLRAMEEWLRTGACGA